MIRHNGCSHEEYRSQFKRNDRFPSAARPARSRTLLLVANTGDRCWFVARRRRPWDQMLARWRALTLDTELAAGCSADDEWLRAVRAGMLVAPGTRRKLAREWENVLDRAGQPRYSRDQRVPISRGRILAAEEDIRQMVVSLRSPLPVPVRGAAMANLLLMSGAGPVYDGRSQVDLSAAVQDAIRYLDPSTELMAPSSDF